MIKYIKSLKINKSFMREMFSKSIYADCLNVSLKLNANSFFFFLCQISKMPLNSIVCPPIVNSRFPLSLYCERKTKTFFER